MRVRVVVPLSVVLVGLLVAGSPVAAGAEDPVTVKTETHGTESACPTGFGSCPASWDSNETATPGDDKLESSLFVHKISLTIRPPVAPTQRVEIHPRDITIRHPVYRDVNQTWLTLNDTRPAIVRPYASFESRWQHYCGQEGDWSSDDWGIFITVYPPAPFLVKGCDSFDLFEYCWDYCSLDDETYMQQSEDEIQPFPNDVFLRNHDHDSIKSDEYARNTFESIEHCMWASTIECDTAAVQPALRAAEEQYFAASPGVSVGFQFNRTVVKVRPDHSEPSSASENAAALRPRSDAPPTIDLKVPRSTPAAAERSDETLRDSAPNAAIGSNPSPTLPLLLHPASQASISPLSLLAFAGTVAAAAILAVLGWLLYSRIMRRDALEQVTRRRINELIRQQPGLRMSSIAGVLGIDRTTARFHLRKMQAWGDVRRGEGTRPGYFPAGQCAEEARAAAVLAKSTPNAIYTALKRLGEGSHSELAAMVGVSLPAVGRALHQLEIAGLATQERTGRRIIARPTSYPLRTPNGSASTMAGA